MRVRDALGPRFTDADFTTGPLATKGFTVLPRRWVVERTLSWLMRTRRLVRDYERHTDIAEAMMLWSMTMVMTRRPARRPA
ncbi:transposase [Kitasatospora sp. GP82]|nr:transposase [Kitasatospora sp. GP82]